MAVTAVMKGNEIVIQIGTNFDVQIYDDFNRSYIEHLNSIRSATIDLTHTQYIDSSALGMLLLFKEKINADKKDIQIVNVNDEVKALFDTASFDELFDMP